MKHLNIGSIKIPVSAATKSAAILAKRGAGKTYTAAVFAEEYAKVGVPFVVFDPIDVWWGLRLKADGKGKGLPVVVFGLEHADIQITRDDGPRIARAIVKENISCVISTFGMPKVAQRHLIAEFAEELLKINNTPRHVFIEEAHEFVPQRVQSGLGKCFSAVEALVVMGRNRGIGVSLINQRAATLNKDVLTQVDTLFAFRNVAPQDRKALKEWVDAHAAEDDFNAFMASLPSLPTGEGWIWSPEFMETFERIKIRKRETFHPDREKLGVDFKIPTISQMDIQGFIESFSVKPKVEHKLATKGGEVTLKVQKDLGTGEYAKVKKENEVLRAQVAKANEGLEKWKQYAELLETNIKEREKTFAFIMRNERPTSKSVLVSERKVEAPVAKPKEDVVVSGEEITLGKCERAVYSFLFANPDKAFTKIQLGAVTGYSPKSGGFNNALYRLNSLGLSQKRGDGIQVGMFVDSLADPSDSYSPDIWLTKLGKCEREIYKMLRDYNERPMTKDEIATYTNYSPTSGGFNNALYHLNAIGLITRTKEGISLNPELQNL